jgi:hypothetical protein
LSDFVPHAISQYRDFNYPAMKRGFQTRDAEMDLARMLGDLAGAQPKG